MLGAYVEKMLDNLPGLWIYTPMSAKIRIRKKPAFISSKLKSPAPSVPVATLSDTGPYVDTPVIIHSPRYLGPCSISIKLRVRVLIFIRRLFSR